MRDEGVGMLASVIQQGRLKELTNLLISSNHQVTHEGIIALSRAIDIGGPPSLVHLVVMGLREGRVTAMGLSAIIYAIVKDLN